MEHINIQIAQNGFMVSWYLQNGKAPNFVNSGTRVCKNLADVHKLLKELVG